ncbi:MAG: hypothetical protein SWJ54_15155 [Cyanobacteriota bacterium]|nr:hypothetical protein [Cyanobacteriota bacterium]
MTQFQAKAKYWLKNSQPVDRVAIAFMLVLSVLIGVLLLSGDRTTPKVREFSWNNRQIGADDQGFIMTFNRPMNRSSVERNLRIDPPLPGKISWAGRRMAYTLVEPAPYGTPFSVQLQDARDQLYAGNEGTEIEPFSGYFRTRDRAFAYIGVSEEKEGRLILTNLSQESPQPIALTPPDLVVLEFEPYPNGDKILFSAISRQDQTSGQFDSQLYTVTTGINPHSPQQQSKRNKTAGEVKRILNSKTYRNLKFDLSPNGEIIVVQRVNKKDPADFGPWIIESGRSPQPLRTEGGDFLIGPDSESLLIAQGPDLTTILPLEPGSEPLEFLPRYGQVLDFTKDGSAAAMVKFNLDGTRSLFLVNNQGEERELYRTPPFGNILNAQFDPSNQLLFCLLTELLDDREEYIEQPYIAVIDLETDNLVPLVILPNQQEINMSLSPDGLALLFDQTVVKNQQNSLPPEDAPRSEGGDTILTSRLWILPLEILSDPSGGEIKPEELPFFGFNPRWLP